jgi:hypothetical protein
MKKMMFLLFLTIAMCSPASMGAVGVVGFPTVRIDGIPTEKKLSVVISELKESHTIKLTDLSAMVLMEVETGANTKFAKLLNLTSLPDGTYHIVVEGSQRKMVQPIVLSKTGVSIDDYRKRIYYKPYVNITDTFIDVSLYNGRIATVSIAILNKYDEVVYEETLENIITVQRRYDMEDLPFGKYTIKVATQDDTYSQTFVAR